MGVLHGKSGFRCEEREKEGIELPSQDRHTKRRWAKTDA